ncbi:MAG TPA: methyltransferase domain-containing protein, partial [Rhodopila sp.]|nr:methyltransferase domain-containing protein [Rhodopila sp.]
DIEAADRVLTDGIANGPANAPLCNAAMMLNLRRRDFTRAVMQADQAIQAGVADATTFALQGHAYCSLGRHDQAALAYQAALKLAPEDQRIRHLAAAHGLIGGDRRAPAAYIREAFDAYATRFEGHLVSLGYAIPSLIAGVVARHPKIASGAALGPVLDLGCGTGLAAMALSDLPLGPFTGVDLSPNMLAEAERKRLYARLRQADIIDELSAQHGQWPLIVAADVVCYFGGLTELMRGIVRCLAPDGWFVFSVETLLPDRDGVVPGNGDWALLRQGRYAHSHDYVYDCVNQAGLRIVRSEQCVIRREGGAEVAGLLLTVTPVVAC